MRGIVRRSDKVMDRIEMERMLEESLVGRLGTYGGHMPYITPVNFAYHKGCIYIHSALEGHKLDNIMYCSNVCFEVDEMVSIVERDNPCRMSTWYRSVVVFGTASILDDEDEKADILGRIVGKYSKSKETKITITRDQSSRVCIIEIKPETITGKKSGEAS